jgi:hypothetical protein
VVKDTRKYYRVSALYTQPNTGITVANIEVRIEAYFTGNEDLRMDFHRSKIMIVNLQKFVPHKDESPYWFITGYEFPEDGAYQFFDRFGPIAHDIKEIIDNREKATRVGLITADDQIDLSKMGYTEIEYGSKGGYWYPKEFAPTQENPLYKWIILLNPKDVPAKSRPKVTHTYNGGDKVAYHGFVYADTSEQAHQRIYERLVHYEQRLDLYEAYSKYNPLPVPKYIAYPLMKRIDEN